MPEREGNVDVEYVAYARYLASRLGRVNKLYPYFQCLDPRIKEILAYCKIFPIVCPTAKFNKFLKEKGIPSLEILGIARWQPDILTELAAKVAQKPRRVNARKEIEDLMKNE